MIQETLDLILGVMFAAVLPLIMLITLITVTVDMRLNRVRRTASAVSDLRFVGNPKGRKQFIRALDFAVNSRAGGYGINTSVFLFKSLMEKTRDPSDKSYCAEYIGRCYEAAGDSENAKKSYETALELSPSNTYALGRLAELVGDAGKAEDYYARILYYDASSAEDYYRLGRLYAGSGRPDASDKAIEQYEKAIFVNNGFVAPMAEAAIEYAKKGDKKNVFKYFALAMANDLFEYEKLEEAVKVCLVQSF